MDREDEDLILEYNHQGHPEALAVVFHRYKKTVFNYALRILSNRADAEDVMSDVFLIIAQKKYQSHPSAKFSTWLFTVTRHSCIDKIRQRKNMFSLWIKNEEKEEMEALQIPDPDALVREKLAAQETSGHIKDAIEKLPLAQKEALVLREYHQLSYEEISRVLECSLEKVKILIFRARERLRLEIPSFLKEENYD